MIRPKCSAVAVRSGGDEEQALLGLHRCERQKTNPLDRTMEDPSRSEPRTKEVECEKAWTAKTGHAGDAGHW